MATTIPPVPRITIYRGEKWYEVFSSDTGTPDLSASQMRVDMALKTGAADVALTLTTGGGGVSNQTDDGSFQVNWSRSNTVALEAGLYYCDAWVIDGTNDQLICRFMVSVKNGVRLV